MRTRTRFLEFSLFSRTTAKTFLFTKVHTNNFPDYKPYTHVYDVCVGKKRTQVYYRKAASMRLQYLCIYYWFRDLQYWSVFSPDSFFTLNLLCFSIFKLRALKQFGELDLSYKIEFLPRTHCEPAALTTSRATPLCDQCTHTDHPSGDNKRRRSRDRVEFRPIITVDPPKSELVREADVYFYPFRQTYRANEIRRRTKGRAAH